MPIMQADKIYVKAGAAIEAKIGGVMYVSTADSGSVGTGLTNLLSYVIPASTLAATGDSIWFEASFKLAANANTKSAYLYFGSALVMSWSAATANVEIVMKGRIYRTGSTAQKIHAEMITNQAVIDANVTTATQTLSGAVTIKGQGQGTTSNDVVMKSFIVGWDPNNT